MINAPHWQNLEARHTMLNKAWQNLKRVREKGNLNAERQATLQYLQALQQVYETSQAAVSLTELK